MGSRMVGAVMHTSVFFDCFFFTRAWLAHADDGHASIECLCDNFLFHVLICFSPSFLPVFLFLLGRCCVGVRVRACVPLSALTNPPHPPASLARRQPVSARASAFFF